jgi:hypothetical protein
MYLRRFVDIVAPKFRKMWIEAWLEIYWPLWAVSYTQSAMLALLACWYSRPLTPKGATELLGSYLVLILIAIEIAFVLDAHPLFLAGEFAGLSVIFIAIAHWKRTANGLQNDSSVSRGRPAS